MGSQGVGVSLWELLPFLTCCVQFTGHWLLIWEAGPDSSIAMSISSLWNKLIKSCISPLFGWITCFIQGSLGTLQHRSFCCAGAVVDAAGDHPLCRAGLKEPRGSGGSVVLGLQAQRRMLHKHRESFHRLCLINSGYCYHHQQIWRAGNLPKVVLDKTRAGIVQERKKGENKIYCDDFSHLNISVPGKLTSYIYLWPGNRDIVVWIASCSQRMIES